ncbi:MFS transporter [Streptomyces sp. NPDC005236]|uniref:MFS transporter n=1 Tax=Streptomyces sp. NPDC005236 TaxID=3157028 RepID=UPI0033B9DD12
MIHFGPLPPPRDAPRRARRFTHGSADRIRTCARRRCRSLRATRGLLPGALVIAGGVCGMLFPSVGKGPLLLLLVALSGGFVAAGYGIAFAGLSDVVPPSQRGPAFGFVTAVYSLGGIAGPAVAGALVAGSATRAGGYTETFVGLGAVVLVGGLLALALVHPERDVALLHKAAADEVGYQRFTLTVAGHETRTGSPPH